MSKNAVWHTKAIHLLVVLAVTLGMLMIPAVASAQAAPPPPDPDLFELKPGLGLDAKGSEQTFVLYYDGEIAVMDNPDFPMDLLWAFEPGVNLNTVGTVGSGADVIVTDGGKPGIGEDPIPTPSPGPDNFVKIYSRAPELGDCVIKVYLDVGDGEPPILVEVAAAEKKWGELHYSDLDVHYEGENDDVVDHEIEVDSGTGYEEGRVEEDLREMVTVDFLQLEDMEYAGGALVNWYLLDEDEDGLNEAYIRGLMEDISTRAGADGVLDMWTARGKYAPGENSADVLETYIIDESAWAANTEFIDLTDVELIVNGGMLDVGVEIDEDMINPAWWAKNITQDGMPGEIRGFAGATIANYDTDAVLIVTVVEYQEEYNGENMILIQLGKKQFGRAPAPSQVKTPQVRWAGEKIVLEKDWSGELPPSEPNGDEPKPVELGDGRHVDYVAVFSLEGESIGNLVAIKGCEVMDPHRSGLPVSADQVITGPDHDGVFRVILETEQQGQADVNASLYHVGHHDYGPIDEHGFIVYFLAFEEVALAETSPWDITPEASLKNLKPAEEDAEVTVKVTGWFTSDALPPTARDAVDVDINGDGTYDIVLPEGRYILPDDWPVLAGFNYALRPNYDLMDQAHNDGITAVYIDDVHDALGPYDSGVVTTDPPNEAEFPSIGPFSGLQRWSSEDVWEAVASIDASAGGYRNTVVPDGMLTVWDAPMPQALVIFDVVTPVSGALHAMDKTQLAGYGFLDADEDGSLDADELFQSPFYSVEVPASKFLPASGYNWDSWGDGHPYPYWEDLTLASIISDVTEDPIDTSDVEVYTDNHGIAGVAISALPMSGSVAITATAEFPYTPLRAKYAPLTSDLIIATWGALELDSYFEAWPRNGDAPLTVTFTNLSNGGVTPYVATIWNWGDGSPLEYNVAMDPGDTLVHTYTEDGSFIPSLTITDSSLPLPLVSDESKEFNYIVVGAGSVPVVDEPDAEDGFATISDYLLTAYSFKAGEGVGGWTVYNPNWPDTDNTLETLYMARGYWINVSQDCTLEWGSRDYYLSSGWNLIGWLGR
ncbi:PKD domain-containing protein [Chloroflexota bacterium]